MKYKFIALPLLVVALQATPIMQFAAYAGNKPIPVAAAGSSNNKKVKKFELEDGTSVRLKFKEDISSKTALQDQPVYFSVAEDVFLNGKLVIAEGAVAKGVVREVQKSGFMGKKGKLDILIRQVELTTGEKVKLRASRENGGQVSGGVIAVAAIINPLFLLIKGKNVSYQAGAEFDAYVAEDYDLNPSDFDQAQRPSK
jgi:hypothetical protein